MTFSTGAGSTLAISATTPVTADLAGYGALSYVEVGSVESIGSIGASYSKTEFQPFRGAKLKFKSTPDYGSLGPKMALDESDAGQLLLRAASDDISSKLYAFQVTYPTGAKRFFQAQVFGFPEAVDSADAVIMATPVIEINTVVVRQAAGQATPDPTPLPTPAITYANSTTVYANATGFKDALLAIEQQIAARGG